MGVEMDESVRGGSFPEASGPKSTRHPDRPGGRAARQLG